MGDDDDNKNGNDNCIAWDDRIKGGCHKRHTPWGRTATAAALACHGFDIVVIAERSDAVRECANARTFECHHLADVRIVVLGRGKRDDGADGIVIVGGDGGTRGNVHCDRRGAAADDGDADCNDILCLTKLYLIFIYIYHYIDCANHSFGGPNHDDSVCVDAPTTTPAPQLSSTTC